MGASSFIINVAVKPVTLTQYHSKANRLFYSNCVLKRVLNKAKTVIGYSAKKKKKLEECTKI